MKLYYTPGACSMASRIVLHELGIEADFERVDLKTKQTEHGADFRRINPLGYVPALTLDDGRTLTENGAILPFLAGLKPGTLVPTGDAFAQAELHQWLGFLSSELHKAFGPFFGGVDSEAREQALAKLSSRIDHVERRLSDGRQFLFGDSFTVADAYAFVILNWAANVDVSLRSWSNVAAFVDQVRSRASVQRSLEEEGLLEAVA